MVQLAIIRRALALSAPVLLAATACGGGDDAVEGLIEEVIESGGEVDVDLDAEDGSITITGEGEDGDQTMTIDIDEDGGTINVEGEDGDQTMTVDSDEDGTVTVETDEGTAIMADEVPAGFPDDVFPVPANTTDVYGMEVSSGDGQSFNLSFRVAQDPQQFWDELRATVPSSATIGNESSGSTGGNFAAQMVFSNWSGWSGVITINEIDGNAGVNYLLQPAG
ncbi:MAG: hypothetical protein GY929_06155 [Actinomycetia bacterium]|nr:hypothetical protein [Actinomycetes bacterium]